MDTLEDAAIYDVIVLGGGIVGLAAAAHLRKAGLRFCVVEAASEVGGTWRDHDYPGCGADTEASTYVPSFEPLFTRHRYPTRDEVFEYCRRIARVHVGYENVHLNEKVQRAEFHGSTQEWHLETATTTWRARCVIFATFSGGAVDQVKLPRFKNQEAFSGPIVHSSALGRDPRFFDGKQVVIVGCGASTIQIVPSICEYAKSITVLRRSMPYIKTCRLTPGPRTWLGYKLQGLRVRLKNELISCLDGLPWLEFLYRWPYRWVEYGLRRGKLPREAIPPVRQPVQCTRRGFDYLGFRAALNEEHVELVDVSTGGIEGYYTGGVIANSRQYPADVVVMATGYHMGQLSFNIYVDGREFDTNPEALVGMYGFIDGLPNAQVSVFGSPVWIIPPRLSEFNTKYFIRTFQHMRSRGCNRVAIRSDFAHKMTETVRNLNRHHVVLSQYCPSFRYLLSTTAQEKQGSTPAKEAVNLAFVPFPSFLMETITRLTFSFRHFDFEREGAVVSRATANPEARI